MQIRFERSGGFAGLTLSTTIDPDELPPETAQELLENLEDSGLLAQPTGDDAGDDLESTPPSYVDEMTYKVTLEVAGYEHTVCVTESELTPEMTELFRCLTKLARRSPEDN